MTIGIFATIPPLVLLGVSPVFRRFLKQFVQIYFFPVLPQEFSKGFFSRILTDLCQENVFKPSLFKDFFGIFPVSFLWFASQIYVGIQLSVSLEVLKINFRRVSNCYKNSS